MSVLTGIDPTFAAAVAAGTVVCPTPAARSDADELPAAPHDPVNRPRHYTAHPSGVECITITEHLGFCVGNAIKYLWRAGLKGQDAVEDLKKARWYIDREIKRLGGEP